MVGQKGTVVSSCPPPAPCAAGRTWVPCPSRVGWGTEKQPDLSSGGGKPTTRSPAGLVAGGQRPLLSPHVGEGTGGSGGSTLTCSPPRPHLLAPAHQGLGFSRTFWGTHSVHGRDNGPGVTASCPAESAHLMPPAHSMAPWRCFICKHRGRGTRTPFRAVGGLPSLCLGRTGGHVKA